MVGSPPSSDEPLAGIDVTPLVDVALVLPVVLMISAGAGGGRALALDLPRPGPSTADPLVVLPVELGPDGEALVSGRAVAGDAAFAAAVREAGAESAAGLVALAAGGRRPQARVGLASDLVKQAGISEIAFAAPPAPAAPAPLPPNGTTDAPWQAAPPRTMTRFWRALTLRPSSTSRSCSWSS